MKTVEYLDAVKEKLQLPSDYALAKVLELRPSAISAYRNAGGTFGKATAIKVAKILGVHPLTVRADAQLERAKASPDGLALLRELASKIVGVLVAAGAGALLLAGPRPAYAVQGEFNKTVFAAPIGERPNAGRNTHCRRILARALAWLRGWL